MKYLAMVAMILASNVVIAQEDHNEMIEYMKPGLSFESISKPGDGSTKIVGLKYTEDGTVYSIGTNSRNSELGLSRNLGESLCVALGFKGVVNFIKDKLTDVDVAYLVGPTSKAKPILKENRNSWVISQLFCYTGSDVADLQVRTSSLNKRKDILVVTDPTINYEGESHPMVMSPHDYYNHGVCRAFGYEEVSAKSIRCSNEGAAASASFDENGFLFDFETSTFIGTMNTVGSLPCRLSSLTCKTKIKEVSYKVLE